MIQNCLRFRKILVSMLVLALLFAGITRCSGAVLASTPKSQPAAVLLEGSDGVISARQDVAAWKASVRSWTKEELLAAKPYPALEIKDAGELSLTPSEPQGKPGFIQGGLPGSEKAALAEEGDQAVFSFASPLGYTYPAPFTRYQNLQGYSRYPYITVGVLFFKQNGISYRCSASSIGNYAIWTAGHCIHLGDNSSSGWSYNVVFIPAYSNGTAPYGQWSAANLIVNNNWYTYKDLTRDVGGAVLYTLGGYKISQKVGWLSFAYNQSTNLHWFDIAYPSAAPFNGKYQQICAASYAYSYSSLGTPYPTGIGCDMTEGSGGGPWIYKLSGVSGATNYLNGHNGFRRSGYPKEMFSPYFGMAAYNLWYALQTISP